VTYETIRTLCEAALDAAEITKSERDEDPSFQADANGAYEALMDMWENEDLTSRTVSRTAGLPHPALGAPAVFRAAYEAALKA
jgi:hypothetical protein